jgi:hypothetical protein
MFIVAELLAEFADALESSETETFGQTVSKSSFLDTSRPAFTARCRSTSNGLGAKSIS